MSSREVNRTCLRQPTTLRSAGGRLRRSEEALQCGVHRTLVMNNNVKWARDGRDVCRKLDKRASAQLLGHEHSGKTTDSEAQYNGSANGFRTAKNQRAVQPAKMWQQSAANRVSSARALLTNQPSGVAQGREIERGMWSPLLNGQ